MGPCNFVMRIKLANFVIRRLALLVIVRRYVGDILRLQLLKLKLTGYTFIGRKHGYENCRKYVYKRVYHLSRCLQRRMKHVLEIRLKTRSG